VPLRFDLLKQLDQVLAKVRDSFGPNAEHLVELFDQILHINRVVESQRPTTLSQVKQFLGEH
jgi:hypothetical protein